ncbi:hypothetical protein KR009_004224 [Drosophila setifemur]|nr:hypothetical protein KR009_004224 [Drosophila setifemur]
MEQMCAQMSGTGYVGNPSSCHGWGYCQGQKLVGWGTCKDNLVYNSQTGSCGFANKTVCATSAVSTCTAAASPMVVADPNNCNQYCVCDGKGTLQYGSCGTDGVYAANNQTCVWGPTCPQSTICQFMLNDIYVGDPDNCGQYLQCLNGYGYAGSCASGKTYNLQNGFCQSTNQCLEDGSSGSTTDGEFTVGQVSTTICGSGYDTAETLDDVTYKFVSDGTTCYGFYYCEDAESNGIWNSCATGTHFNPKLGKCVSPATYACPYNRCGNVNAAFMTKLATNCESYWLCSKTSTTGTCPTGNQFYDEVHDICTSTNPKYAVCTVAS